MNALDNFQPPLPSPNPALPDNAPITAKLILRRVNGWITAIEAGIWLGAAAIAAWNRHQEYKRYKILEGIHTNYQNSIAVTDKIMSDRTRNCAAAQNAVDAARDQQIINGQSDVTVNYAIVNAFTWFNYPRKIVTRVTVICVANC